MFSIALYQFGALLSLNRRTPFPSIPYTFGTVFAQYRGSGCPVQSCPDASEAPFLCSNPIHPTLHSGYPKTSQATRSHSPGARATRAGEAGLGFSCSSPYQKLNRLQEAACSPVHQSVEGVSERARAPDLMAVRTWGKSSYQWVGVFADVARLGVSKHPSSV